MKKLALVLMFVLAFAGLMMAQNWSSTVDVLGAHQNQGRGCAGCHAPHSGSFGSGHGGASDAGNYALWGQDASPLYGKTVAFGDNGRYVEVLPSSLTAGGPEVSGILLCLSCHDGNLTQSNMMQNWSYEQQINLLSNTTYGSQKIPTLLGNDGTTAGNYTNDHPVGVNATISASTANGLVWANNSFTVTAGKITEKKEVIKTATAPSPPPAAPSLPGSVSAGRSASRSCGAPLRISRRTRSLNDVPVGPRPGRRGDPGAVDLRGARLLGPGVLQVAGASGQ